MSERFFGGRSLARELGLTELELHELTQCAKLAFDYSVDTGIVIETSQLPAWRQAAALFLEQTL
jgi:hypothetical protein